MSWIKPKLRHTEVSPLLYVYAQHKVTGPNEDKVTQKMQQIFDSCAEDGKSRGAYEGGSFTVNLGFMGVHHCVCGVRSDSQDVLMITPCGKKFATNTLCVHYLRDHREEITPGEMERVEKFLAMF